MFPDGSHSPRRHPELLPVGRPSHDEHDRLAASTSRAYDRNLLAKLKGYPCTSSERNVNVTNTASDTNLFYREGRSHLHHLQPPISGNQSPRRTRENLPNSSPQSDAAVNANVPGIMDSRLPDSGMDWAPTSVVPDILHSDMQMQTKNQPKPPSALEIRNREARERLRQQREERIRRERGLPAQSPPQTSEQPASMLHPRVLNVEQSAELWQDIQKRVVDQNLRLTMCLMLYDEKPPWNLTEEQRQRKVRDWYNEFHYNFKNNPPPAVVPLQSELEMSTAVVPQPQPDMPTQPVPAQPESGLTKQIKKRKQNRKRKIKTDNQLAEDLKYNDAVKKHFQIQYPGIDWERPSKKSPLLQRVQEATKMDSESVQAAIRQVIEKSQQENNTATEISASEPSCSDGDIRVSQHMTDDINSHNNSPPTTKTVSKLLELVGEVKTLLELQENDVLTQLSEIQSEIQSNTSTNTQPIATAPCTSSRDITGFATAASTSTTKSGSSPDPASPGLSPNKLSSSDPPCPAEEDGQSSVTGESENGGFLEQPGKQDEASTPTFHEVSEAEGNFTSSDADNDDQHDEESSMCSISNPQPPSEIPSEPQLTNLQLKNRAKRRRNRQNKKNRQRNQISDFVKHDEAAEQESPDNDENEPVAEPRKPDSKEVERASRHSYTSNHIVCWFVWVLQQRKGELPERYLQDCLSFLHFVYTEWVTDEQANFPELRTRESSLVQTLKGVAPYCVSIGITAARKYLPGEVTSNHTDSSSDDEFLPKTEPVAEWVDSQGRRYPGRICQVCLPATVLEAAENESENELWDEDEDESRDEDEDESCDEDEYEYGSESDDDRPTRIVLSSTLAGEFIYILECLECYEAEGVEDMFEQYVSLLGYIYRDWVAGEQAEWVEFRTEESPLFQELKGCAEYCKSMGVAVPREYLPEEPSSTPPAEDEATEPVQSESDGSENSVQESEVANREFWDEDELGPVPGWLRAHYLDEASKRCRTGADDIKSVVELMQLIQQKNMPAEWISHGVKLLQPWYTYLEDEGAKMFPVLGREYSPLAEKLKRPLVEELKRRAPYCKSIGVSVPRGYLPEDLSIAASPASEDDQSNSQTSEDSNYSPDAECFSDDGVGSVVDPETAKQEFSDEGEDTSGSESDEDDDDSESSGSESDEDDDHSESSGSESDEDDDDFESESDEDKWRSALGFSQSLADEVRICVATLQQSGEQQSQEKAERELWWAYTCWVAQEQDLHSQLRMRESPLFVELKKWAEYCKSIGLPVRREYLSGVPPAAHSTTSADDESWSETSKDTDHLSDDNGSSSDNGSSDHSFDSAVNGETFDKHKHMKSSVEEVGKFQLSCVSWPRNTICRPEWAQTKSIELATRAKENVDILRPLLDGTASAADKRSQIQLHARSLQTMYLNCPEQEKETYAGLLTGQDALFRQLAESAAYCKSVKMHVPSAFLTTEHSTPERSIPLTVSTTKELGALYKCKKLLSEPQSADDQYQESKRLKLHYRILCREVAMDQCKRHGRRSIQEIYNGCSDDEKSTFPGLATGNKALLDRLIEASREFSRFAGNSLQHVSADFLSAQKLTLESVTCPDIVKDFQQQCHPLFIALLREFLEEEQVGL